MQTKQLGRDLTQGKVAPQLLRFSVPFVLATMLQTVYNLVDAVVVGHFVGTDGLSAVSGAGELIQLYTFIAIGFGGAGQTLIGQFVGAQDWKNVQKTVGTLFTLLMALAVIVTIFCVSTARLQVGWINMPKEAVQGGVGYLTVCSGGMVFIFGYNMVSSVLRGMGDSKRPLLFIAVASVVNLVLDLLFVAVFHWGALGAGLATVMGQGISFFSALVYLYRNRVAFGFDFKPTSFVPQRNILAALARLGIPMAVQGGLINISMLYVSTQINAFGVAASAANGIHLKLNGVVRIGSNSLNQAGSAMIAQCMGAKKQERVQQVFRCILFFGTIYCAICAMAIFCFPQQIFGLFNTDPAVLDYARIYSVIGAIECFGFALRAPCFAVTNGTGAATLGMAAGLVDGVVARIGFSMLFGNILGMGVAGYWLGNMVAGFCNVLITGPYYLSGVWKRRGSLVKEEKAHP